MLHSFLLIHTDFFLPNFIHNGEVWLLHLLFTLFTMWRHLLWDFRSQIKPHNSFCKRAKKTLNSILFLTGDICSIPKNRIIVRPQSWRGWNRFFIFAYPYRASSQQNVGENETKLKDDYDMIHRLLHLKNSYFINSKCLVFEPFNLFHEKETNKWTQMIQKSIHFKSQYCLLNTEIQGVSTSGR